MARILPAQDGGDVGLILVKTLDRKWQPTPDFAGNPMDRGAWRTTVHGVTKSENERCTSEGKILRNRTKEGRGVCATGLVLSCGLQSFH